MAFTHLDPDSYAYRSRCNPTTLGGVEGPDPIEAAIVAAEKHKQEALAGTPR